MKEVIIEKRYKLISNDKYIDSKTETINNPKRQHVILRVNKNKLKR
jgi:hypothetical protein